ncbi:MAG TPA: hypothetical protein VFB78_08560 [Acidimicrobiales bacterium]|nr:hypothetical protein [Acidimicrobiales bacterium]
MAVIVSVHIADVGVPRALRLMARRPSAKRVAGLRNTNVGLAAPMSASLLPRPSLRRAVLVGFWDDEAALDRFVADSPVAAALAGGWHARLEPLRAHGTWPGLPVDVPKGRRTDYDGPSVVLTLGRTRLSQVRRFLKSSSRASGAVIGAPGVLWATGFASPPFLATCSLWESTDALSAYAYGAGDRAHPDAIDAGRAKPFHKQEAFIRFRPVRVEGSLGGVNPLTVGAFPVA